jgi:uncharacterized protein (DUF1501 family)
MRMTRREFLIKSGVLIATISFGGTLLWKGTSLLSGDDQDKHTNALLVVQLSGGNDGINTVIPYGAGAYYDARPTLNYKQSQVLRLNNELGLHPQLKELHAQFTLGNLAIIQGVGYPNPNYSHFRSMEIWQTGEPDKWIRSGWLARYVETSLRNNPNPLKAIHIGGNGSKTLYSDSLNVPIIQTLQSAPFMDPNSTNLNKKKLSHAFLDMYGEQNNLDQLRVACQRGIDAYKSVEAIHSLTPGYQTKIEYPNTNFAKGLKLVSQLLAGRSGTRVFNLQLGGFDDHSNEKDQHTKTLQQLDEGLGAFYKDLKVQGLHKRVVTLVFSEFGRRVKENNSGGTDHGTAAPVFVLGDKVKGGLYGAYPSLTKLTNGDLKYEVDFRSVYSTLLDKWLQGDGRSVLGQSFETMRFV